MRKRKAPYFAIGILAVGAGLVGAYYLYSRTHARPVAAAYFRAYDSYAQMLHERVFLKNEKFRVASAHILGYPIGTIFAVGEPTPQAKCVASSDIERGQQIQAMPQMSWAYGINGALELPPLFDRIGLSARLKAGQRVDFTMKFDDLRIDQLLGWDFAHILDTLKCDRPLAGHQQYGIIRGIIYGKETFSWESAFSAEVSAWLGSGNAGNGDPPVGASKCPSPAAAPGRSLAMIFQTADCTAPIGMTDLNDKVARFYIVSTVTANATMTKVDGPGADRTYPWSWSQGPIAVADNGKPPQPPGGGNGQPSGATHDSRGATGAAGVPGSNRPAAPPTPSSAPGQAATRDGPKAKAAPQAYADTNRSPPSLFGWTEFGFLPGTSKPAVPPLPGPVSQPHTAPAPRPHFTITNQIDPNWRL